MEAVARLQHLDQLLCSSVACYCPLQQRSVSAQFLSLPRPFSIPSVRASSDSTRPKFKIPQSPSNQFLDSFPKNASYATLTAVSALFFDGWVNWVWSQAVLQICRFFQSALSSSNTTLRGINLTFIQGMRVAVCCTVGSGKSSLLSCILGELPKLSGTIRVCGTKAFVAQSAWIQSGKIEENILFGKEMDRERYEMVLEACSLKKDLEILPFGDQTIIGERGINLSGGQKQRIQIARALYQDADIYLFDDPFSAVDAHRGSHLFKECLLGCFSSKTVIYVTHQVEFLSAANLILVMKDGEITECGKYSDLLNSRTDFF